MASNQSHFTISDGNAISPGRTHVRDSDEKKRLAKDSDFTGGQQEKFVALTDANIAAYANITRLRRPLKVLLVDRSEDVMLIMAELMNHLGYDCIQATSASEALCHASEFVPDVVISGMRLMECSGGELAERLRGNPFTANAVLIAVTGHNVHEGNQADFVRFNYVLQKPFSISVLADLLTFCHLAHAHMKSSIAFRPD